MQLQHNISLKAFNTFGIDVSAQHFASFSDTTSLQELLTQNAQLPQLVIGGGSNMLLTRNVEGLVLKNEIKGIDLVKEDAHNVFVRAGAGENWHQFVTYCLQRNWAGVENLSLIPGNIGASPMQNIGAYGVELKDVFFELEALEIDTQKVYTFTLNDCEFGYRESIFKRKYRDRFIILAVTYRLFKEPRINTGYGAIGEELERMGVKEPDIRSVSQAVINIRRSKLPDPAVIGNAGSFFKNPQVSRQEFDDLKQHFPGIIGYENGDESIKLAAGWLIEQCGWKGYRKGDAGCNEKQALVLVNFGHATGQEIYALSEEILQSVKSKFGVLLEREVNIV